MKMGRGRRGLEDEHRSQRKNGWSEVLEAK